jgi:serine/threonine protein kinase
MSQHQSRFSKVDNDDDLNGFANVLARLKIDAMPAVAATARRECNLIAHTLIPISIECEVDPKYLSGSYHILFIVRFSDGALWIFKIPSWGHPNEHNDQVTANLVSEACTMRLLKEQTTIPIPEVYSFDTRLDNEIGCPYILMEYIEGTSLFDVWFDRSVPEGVLHERRIRCLTDVASTMLQLKKFKFERCGSITFDKTGWLGQNVGPMRFLDLEAMLRPLKNGDVASTPTIMLGPFGTAKDLFLSHFHRLTTPNYKYGQGIHKLLRLLIEYLPQHADIKGFVLSHPDFDIQNFLVTKDGALRAIIDWDGVCAEPKCLGPESYPGWLTRDWDPAMYGYFRKGCLREDSPEELTRYRHEYLRIVEDLKRKEMPEGKGFVDTTLTRQSLVVENILIAAMNFTCTHGIVTKVFKEIARLVAPEAFEEMEESERKSRLRAAERQCDSDDDKADDEPTDDDDDDDDRVQRLLLEAGHEAPEQADKAAEESSNGPCERSQEQNTDLDTDEFRWTAILETPTHYRPEDVENVEDATDPIPLHQAHNLSAPLCSVSNQADNSPAKETIHDLHGSSSEQLESTTAIKVATLDDNDASPTHPQPGEEPGTQISDHQTPPEQASDARKHYQINQATHQTIAAASVATAAPPPQ